MHRRAVILKLLLFVGWIVLSPSLRAANSDSLTFYARAAIRTAWEQDELLGGAELIDALPEGRDTTWATALFDIVTNYERRMRRPVSLEDRGRLQFLRAGIFDQLSKADSAMFYYAAAALSFQQTDRKEWHAWSLYGRLCLVMERNPDLLRSEAVEQLVRLTESASDTYLKTSVYTLLSSIAGEAEDFAAATGWLRKCLTLDLAAEDWAAATYDYYNLAILAGNDGELVLSDSFGRAGITIQQQYAVMDPDLLAATYSLLAQNAGLLGRSALRWEMVDSSRAWTERNNSLSGWIDYYDTFTALLADENQYDSAYFYTLEQQYLQDSLQLILEEDQMRRNLADYQYREAILAKQLAEARAARSFTILAASAAFFLFCLLSFIYLLRQRRKAQRLREENLRILQAQRVEDIMQEHEIETVRAMLEGQDGERARIAQELHDGLGGDLAALRWTYDHLEKEYREIGIPIDRLHTANINLSKAYEQLRDLSHALSFNDLRQFGLIDSLREMAGRIDGVGGLRVAFYSHGESQRLDTQYEIQLFQAIQELTTNVLKHAEADSLSIQLTWLDDELSVIVEDNGKGFDVGTLSEGMGLSSIERRMTDLHARFDIDSGRGGGTTILIDVPLRHIVNG